MQFQSSLIVLLATGALGLAIDKRQEYGASTPSAGSDYGSSASPETTSTPSTGDSSSGSYGSPAASIPSVPAGLGSKCFDSHLMNTRGKRVLMI